MGLGREYIVRLTIMQSNYNHVYILLFNTKLGGGGLLDFITNGFGLKFYPILIYITFLYHINCILNN